MNTTTVTSKGQVTIPLDVRRKLGIRKGSKVEFTVVGDHVEMRIATRPIAVLKSGFGLLKSDKPAVSADFDPVFLLRKRAEK